MWLRDSDGVVFWFDEPSGWSKQEARDYILSYNTLYPTQAYSFVVEHTLPMFDPHEFA